MKKEVGRGGKRWRQGEGWINWVSGVSLSRIRKRSIRDWVDGKMGRGRDRRTGLNKPRSGS